MMAQKSNDKGCPENKFGLPEDFREKQYIYTVASEKRHELLMEPYGVSFPVFRALVYLMQHPDGAAPSQIADDLMILRQSMTNIIDSLEEKRLVARNANPNDRRRIIVKLMPDGEALAKALFQIEQDFTQRIYSHFTSEELKEYYRLQQKMYEVKEQELDKILKEYKEAEILK